MDEWIIDGRKLGFQDAAAAIAPALQPDNLAGNGGLLFKACILRDAFRFGALPWIRGAQRCHHYEIKLPKPETRHLIGTLSSVGVLMLLFKNPSIDDDDRTAYRLCVDSLARLFAAAKPDGQWPFDPVTPTLFVEAGLWDPAPTTLGDVLPD